MMVKQLLLCASVAMLASCASEDPISGVKVSEDNLAKFSGSVEGMVTRAYDASWEMNGHDGADKIGITCNTAGTDYTNIAYKLTDATAGSFEVNTAGQEIYYQNDDEVTFTAYYPWVESLNSATTHAFSTKEQSNSKSFDWLWGQAKGKKASPSVHFPFKHSMSKIVIKVQTGDDVEYADELLNFQLALGNYATDASFNRINGVVTPDYSTIVSAVEPQIYRKNFETDVKNDATLWEETGETEAIYGKRKGWVKNSLILAPQVFGEGSNPNKLTFQAEKLNYQKFIVELDLTNANKKIDGDEAKNALVAGRQYNFTITLNKTDIEVSGDVANWDVTDDTEGDAR